VAVILATAPLTLLGARFAKKHRGMAHGAAALLLLFGLNMKVDPPPPPRIERVQREEEEAGDDEPK
jgi:hypothetical protein